MCARGWVAKEGILSSASLKRRRSVQTFLGLFWRKDHTKICACKNLQDRKKDEGRESVTSESPKWSDIQSLGRETGQSRRKTLSTESDDQMI